MPNLISVIIPVYNHAVTLEETIRSILKQTYRPIEIIIVDDGSTDDFDVVMKKCKIAIEKAGLALKIIKQNNSGAPVARNNGFFNSSGQFVIFIDADTVLEPEMLDKLFKSLILSNRSYAYSDFKYGWKKFLCKQFDPDLLRRNNYIDVSALIKREDFCGFDPSLKRFQDWDLWLTMLEKNKTGVYVPGMLYKKITKGRKGMSRWLPSIFYQLPFKTKSVRDYEASRDIVRQKHGLL